MQSVLFDFVVYDFVVYVFWFCSLESYRSRTSYLNVLCKTFFAGGKWRIWVTTNDNPVAGTDAMVFLSVYGDKGKTDDLVLGCGDGHFESGETDEFNVSTVYLVSYSILNL